MSSSVLNDVRTSRSVRYLTGQFRGPFQASAPPRSPPAATPAVPPARQAVLQGGRALRTETTISNTYDFRTGRKLSNLEDLNTIGFQANRRLLRVERLSHDCTRGDARFEELNAPARVGRQRAPALRFGDPRVLALLGTLPVFRLPPNGFDNRALRRRVAPLLGHAPEQWSAGRRSYDLRRLRLRGLVERLPGTRRYRVTQKGTRTALSYHRTYARVLRPALSVAFDTAGPHATPLQNAVQRFDCEIDKLWKGQSIAAQT